MHWLSVVDLSIHRREDRGARLRGGGEGFVGERTAERARERRLGLWSRGL